MGGDMSPIPRVLIVDDDEVNLALVETMLLPLGYHLDFAMNGHDAIDLATTRSPDVILLDVLMPGLNGFEVVESLRTNLNASHIPIVMLTALHDVEHRIKALKAGADDYLVKPVNMAELQMRVKTLVHVKVDREQMQRHLKRLDAELKRKRAELEFAAAKVKSASWDAIFRLAAAAEYKDDDTGSHIRRMSRYVEVLARRLGLTPERVEMMAVAAQMHDIGKLGIPDQILHKPGKLEPEEWRIMNQHATMGAGILSGSSLDVIQMAEIIALTHHERWDGSGYPKGLRGTDIPLEGRIVAVVDVFDALTSWRCYRVESTFSADKALMMMSAEKGRQFDPHILEVFISARDEILAIKKTYVDAMTHGPAARIT